MMMMMKNSRPSSPLDLFSVDLNLLPPSSCGLHGSAGWGGGGCSVLLCFSVDLRDGHVVITVVITHCKNLHVVAAIENGPSAIDLKPQRSQAVAHHGAPPESAWLSPAEPSSLLCLRFLKFLLSFFMVPGRWPVLDVQPGSFSLFWFLL